VTWRDRLGDAGQAEVGDLGPSASVDHHVARLQVAVQDPLLVRGGQTRAELTRHADRAVLREASDAAQKRREVLAVDVLHRKVVLPLGLADVVDTTDVGVRDLPRQLDLVEKAGLARRVLLQRARQELQRNGLA
jgi:hypothetical protein